MGSRPFAIVVVVDLATRCRQSRQKKNVTMMMLSHGKVLFVEVDVVVVVAAFVFVFYVLVETR